MSMLKAAVILLLHLQAVNQVMTVSTEGGSRDKRSDDSGPLGTVVEKLAQQVSTLTAELSAAQTEIADLKTRTAKQEVAIAFHARRDDNTFDVLPYGPIILSHVIVKVGTGYDQHTGYFHVPVSGMYLFVASAAVHEPASPVWVNIIIDDTMFAQLVSHGNPELDQGTVALPVHLNKGQTVHLANAANRQITLRGEIYTTFSGVLIQSD